MKIAVTFENGEVFQHFGHTEHFKVYEVENGQIVSSEIIDTNGSGHEALAGFLADIYVNVLLCGGIGGGAQAALDNTGKVILKDHMRHCLVDAVFAGDENSIDDLCQAIDKFMK